MAGAETGDRIEAAVTIGPCGKGCIIAITAQDGGGAAVKISDPEEIRFLSDQLTWMARRMVRLMGEEE